MSSSSLSLTKLKSYLPFASDSISHRQKKTKRLLDNLEPEVGFKLTLCANNRNEDKNSGNQTTTTSSSSENKYGNCNVPELNVTIIGARHLPSVFGMKTVEGYCIKVSIN